jgi:protein-disulfide isomerase
VVKGARKSSNRAFYIALVALAIGGIAVLSWLSTRSSGRQVIEVDPTLPSVEAVGYVMGSPDAPIEVLEFADFECPGCAQFAILTGPDVKQRLVETGQIRLRLMDFPLSIHRNAWTASLSAACANEQGKVWEMHDAIFGAQDRWNTQATNDPLGVMVELARGIGLDADQFEECVASRKYQANVQAHMQEAERRGVQATPSFIIGGKLIPGAISYDDFKSYVDAALAEANAAGGTRPAGTPQEGSDSANAAR